MNTLNKLKLLSEISDNPNLNGGVWSSLNLFMSTANEIVQNDKEFKEINISDQKKSEILNELSEIRAQLLKKCGLKQISDLERKKNSRCNGHVFKSKVSKFLQSYRNHFDVEIEENN